MSAPFVISGRPRIVLAGEIHYFRLPRETWEHRVDEAHTAGLNAVASYIPWLCHEEAEGDIDLTGRTREELDLGAFIDLCRDRGLFFIARPGPFIMAELKNEGIPYWVYEKHPHIRPATWKGKRPPAAHVDYLDPAFLAEARHWYAAVMPVLASRLASRGGTVIAVQLDNEIGMLPWVANTPDLSDNALAHLTGTVGAGNFPGLPADPRAPDEDGIRAYHLLVGQDARRRYAEYVETLASVAEEYGVRDIPFLVNIHGCSHGRGKTFPIGISQLMEAYHVRPDLVPGTDIYLGELTTTNLPDLYVLNAFLNATLAPGQPAGCFEFEAGHADYGQLLAGRLDPSSGDFKLRINLIQGHRVVNYYLFSGGYNYRLAHPRGDGNDRIAFTGERHGFAAPVDPEGRRSYVFDRMSRANRAVVAASPWLSTMSEETDSIALAFVPDSYMTEYRYPDSEVMAELHRELVSRREAILESPIRALLLSGYSFTACDLQDDGPDPARIRLLILPSSRAMAANVQQRVVDYLGSGGRLFIYGRLPEEDLAGAPCNILAEALGATPTAAYSDGSRPYLSVVPEGILAGIAEVRSHFAVAYDAPSAETLLRIYGTGEVCGFSCAVGSGRAVLVSSSLPAIIDIYARILSALGIERPRLAHDDPHAGVFCRVTRGIATPTGTPAFVHLLNLDGIEKQVHLDFEGTPLFEGRGIRLGPREAFMLPLDLPLSLPGTSRGEGGPGGVDAVIRWATAELVEVGAAHLVFRRSGDDVLVLETTTELWAGGASIERTGRTVVVRDTRPLCEFRELEIRFGGT